MKKHPFFLDFGEAKITSAIICDMASRYTEISIHPHAVKNELDAYDQACQNPLSTFFPQSKFKAALASYVHAAHHTLVCHAVGYHLDEFKHKRAQLENKKCFVVPGYSIPGRGGQGPTSFVVAVLDW